MNVDFDELLLRVLEVPEDDRRAFLEASGADSKVCAELLDLYRDKGLRDSFFRTYTALLGRRLACRDRWDLLAREFRMRDGTNG